jgi:hypothetical protein
MGLHTHGNLDTTWFYEAYFGQLKGATIIDFKFLPDEYEPGQFWPTFLAKLPNGKTVQFEISQDEEGNGPGWIDGLDIEAAQAARPVG